MPGTRLWKWPIPRGTACFIRKYGLRADRWAVHAVHCGLHSGIPDCCILFYVTCMDAVRSAEWRFQDKRYANLVAHVAPGGAGYVPCPACLAARNLVRLRHCNHSAIRGGPEELCSPCRPGCRRPEHRHYEPAGEESA